jgi:fumarate hydratase class I
MRDLTQEILELVRLTSTNLPPDVEKALRTAREQEEPGTAAQGAMDTILSNVEMTRRNSTPICQDTGTPIFFVYYPEGWSPRALREQIKTAIAEATKKTYLRPNAVDSLNGKNTGNNLGDQFFPTIHFEESDGEDLIVALILKGGGCENVGAQYSLPQGDPLNAGRDLEGVRRAALDAVHRAQGEGCAPGFLGIAIGGDRGTSYTASKEALLRKEGEVNPKADLAALEGGGYR